MNIHIAHAHINTREKWLHEFNYLYITRRVIDILEDVLIRLP